MGRSSRLKVSSADVTRKSARKRALLGMYKLLQDSTMFAGSNWHIQLVPSEALRSQFEVDIVNVVKTKLIVSWLIVSTNCISSIALH
jgi:hypothetical protein